MAAKEQKGQAPESEADVWNAISAFEQILEAIPNDRTSLETLAHAYEQIGDLTKAKEYLMRLGDLVVSESDADSAEEVLESLKSFTDDDPAAQELAGKLGELAATSDGSGKKRSIVGSCLCPDLSFTA